MGEKQIPVSISKINANNDKYLKDISRVYAIGINKDNLVPVIFNSNRGIWGFPGGHKESGESMEETVRREFKEETGFSILKCEPKFIIKSVLDEKQEEGQVICFCLVGEKEDIKHTEDETVTEVKLLPVDEVLDTVGNHKLWEDIFNSFKEWIKE